MNQDELKQQVADAAVEYVRTNIKSDAILGVGTGSTANLFIDGLADIKHLFQAAVASSEASAERLTALGIEVLDLNQVDSIQIYVDGADESDKTLNLIKGGGAALTREKIVAQASKQFVCIVDSTKTVEVLGAFPLPVEVIPMARAMVAREIVKLGGNPVWREGVITDNGNHIIDVHGMKITEPEKLETTLNMIPGVVTNGLFAHRPADVLLVSAEEGVKTYTVMNAETAKGNYF